MVCIGKVKNDKVFSQVKPVLNGYILRRGIMFKISEQKMSIKSPYHVHKLKIKCIKAMVLLLKMHMLSLESLFLTLIHTNTYLRSLSTPRITGRM